MIYEMYAIKDVVAGQISEPRLFVNSGVADRWFQTAFVEKSDIAGDLQLWFIGSFNSESGEIVSDPQFVRGAQNEKVSA